MVNKQQKISIIICSREVNINQELRENIEKTIGYPHEFVIINNSENKYSIFEAYNLGIKKSVGEYLCFLHDDIVFHTIGWGKIINLIFSTNSSIGVIGIAGSKIKTKSPSGWWNCPDDLKEINILQHLKNKNIEKWSYGFKQENLSSVAVIDGVFMAVRRDDTIFFNTKLDGFHNYDLNISLEYKIKGYEIVVTSEILLEHFSIGTINKSWVESTMKIHNIYKKNLPLNVSSSVNNFDIDALEQKNMEIFINQLLDFGFILNTLFFWSKWFLVKPLSNFHFLFLKRIIYKIIKKIKTGTFI